MCNSFTCFPANLITTCLCIYNAHNCAFHNLHSFDARMESPISPKTIEMIYFVDSMNAHNFFNFYLPKQFVCIYQFMSFPFDYIIFLVRKLSIQSIQVYECCFPNCIVAAMTFYCFFLSFRYHQIYFQLTLNRTDTHNAIRMFFTLFSEVCAHVCNKAIPIFRPTIHINFDLLILQVCESSDLHLKRQ